jgi:hypothetical protein
MRCSGQTNVWVGTERYGQTVMRRLCGTTARQAYGIDGNTSCTTLRTVPEISGHWRSTPTGPTSWLGPWAPSMSPCLTRINELKIISGRLSESESGNGVQNGPKINLESSPRGRRGRPLCGTNKLCKPPPGICKPPGHGTPLVTHQAREAYQKEREGPEPSPRNRKPIPGEQLIVWGHQQIVEAYQK